MLLSKLLYMKETIGKYRENMHEVAKNKGVSHPEVVEMNRSLDNRISKLQQLLLSSR
jgi:hypothetical protein